MMKFIQKILESRIKLTFVGDFVGFAYGAPDGAFEVPVVGLAAGSYVEYMKEGFHHTFSSQ